LRKEKRKSLKLFEISFVPLHLCKLTNALSKYNIFNFTLCGSLCLLCGSLCYYTEFHREGTELHRVQIATKCTGYLLMSPK